MVAGGRDRRGDGGGGRERRSRDGGSRSSDPPTQGLATRLHPRRISRAGPGAGGGTSLGLDPAAERQPTLRESQSQMSVLTSSAGTGLAWARTLPCGWAHFATTRLRHAPAHNRGKKETWRWALAMNEQVNLSPTGQHGRVSLFLVLVPISSKTK